MAEAQSRYGILSDTYEEIGNLRSELSKLELQKENQKDMLDEKISISKSSITTNKSTYKENFEVWKEGNLLFS